MSSPFVTLAIIYFAIQINVERYVLADNTIIE